MDVFKTLILDTPTVEGAAGTVTSVNLTAGTGISVSGGPITSSGSITVTNTAPSLGGDVVGPASATDNAVVRFDSTTGKLIQNSGVSISDANLLTTTALTVNDNTTLGSSNTDTVTFNARSASGFTPATDDAYDLGSAGHEWRDLYINGTANIDSLVADTADVNGGTIDGATIGGSASAAGTFTNLTASTKVTTPLVDAASSAGGQLRNASGTSQLAWGAGGGSNVSLEVATNINPANAAVSIAPTGTGTLTINPATAGTMNNVAIGATTPASGAFTTLSATGATNLDAGTVSAPGLYLEGETGTGLYRIGANNHGYAVSGSKVLDISSTGLAVTGAVSASSPSIIGGTDAVQYGNLLIKGVTKGTRFVQNSTSSWIEGVDNTGIGSYEPLNIGGSEVNFYNTVYKIVSVTSTGLAVTGSVSDSKGEIRLIPQNSQSAAYTLVLADAGKHILHPSADTTARTFTIPANSSVAYPVGTAITFVNQNGAGAVTIAITTDTMRLAGAGTTGSRTLAANGVATAIKITSTEWIISGTGLT